MKCVNDIEMMEYVANRMPSEKRENVRKHLAECAKCSKSFQESARLWETLGRWDVETTSHNITDRVLASAEKSVIVRKQPHKYYVFKKVSLTDLLRIAALIVIAIGVGQKLGKINAGQKEPISVTLQTEPKYIAALGLDLSGDFSWLINEDDSSNQESQ